MSSREPPAKLPRASQNFNEKKEQDSDTSRTSSKLIGVDPSEENDAEATTPALITQDYFSALPDDCLLDVFRRVDDDDLDEIAVASGRLNALSSIARPRAMKGLARKLTIISLISGFEENVEWEIRILRAKEKPCHFKRVWTKDSPPHTNCDVCTGLRDSNMDRRTRRSIPFVHQLFMIAQAAFKRYDFETIEADLNEGTDVYVELCRRYGLVHAPDFFKLRLDLDDTPNIQALSTWMTEGKPERMEISASQSFQLIDTDFFEKYSAAVSHPSLKIKDYIFSPGPIAAAPLKDRAISALANYADLDIDVMIFDADHIMEFINKRAQKRCEGEWVMRTSRRMDAATIEAGLDPAMEGEHFLPYGAFYETCYKISLRGELIATISASNYQLLPQRDSWQAHNLRESYIEIKFH